jgi:hypothetical protein
MARWKLANAHYVNCQDSEWEYREVDRTTGRSIRKSFPVPRMLNPLDPADWNYSWGSGSDKDGEIVVCYAGKGESKDYVFTGDPTPDMIPVDDEAKEISASFTERWRYKPETDLPGQYSQSLVDKFQAEMSEIQAKPVQVEGLAELVAAITIGQKQTSELIEALVTRRRPA